ncbi:flagellar protein FlaG [Thermodesulfobium sp.]
MIASNKGDSNLTALIRPELLAIKQSQLAIDSRLAGISGISKVGNTTSDEIQSVENNNNKVNIKTLKSIIESLNAKLESQNIKSKFEVYEKINGAYYIRFYNAETNETISEFPPKKYLDMIASFINGSGTLINRKV